MAFYLLRLSLFIYYHNNIVHAYSLDKGYLHLAFVQNVSDWVQ